MKTERCMTTITARFTGFAHTAAELSAYARCIDVFVISLRNGQIIQHTPKYPKNFEEWLLANNIRDINKDWTPKEDIMKR